MTHLGRWLSALIDGELDAAERDHVLNHLAGCEPCLSEANSLRALKRRMTALGDTSADSAVVRRLIDLGRSAPLTASGAPFAGSVREFAASARLPATGRVRPAWHGWRIATGSAGAAFLVIGLVAFMLGAPAASPRPQVTPALDVYWVDHVHDMGQATTKPGMTGQIPSAGSGPGVGAPSKRAAARPPAGKRGATRSHAVKKRAVKKQATAPGQFAVHSPWP
jgi:hypothetical protein